MSFRCLFIIRVLDMENNDLQPYCYKQFGNGCKNKISDSFNINTLKSFDEWYTDVLTTISDANYMKFDEISIKKYICNPIYSIKTAHENLEPCILINKNNFIFGGLLFPQCQKVNFKYMFGVPVDFICGMTSYFLNITKKNPKIKMIDIMPDFYNFIKIMCPYGTPISTNSNLVEFFKNPESILKSLTLSNPEKTILSLNLLPVNNINKNKELRFTFKEIVTGVQHENRSGQAKYDIDIIGEVLLSTSNLDINGEVSFTLIPNQNQNFISRTVLVDILLHPSCLSCNYQTPTSISIQNRKPNFDLIEKTIDDSPNSPNFLVNENSLVQSVTKKYNSIDSNLLTRRLLSIPGTNPIWSSSETNKISSSISLAVKPWSDSHTLLSYKIMQYSSEIENEDISIPFILSCKSPEPPIICSYQLEDMVTSPDIISNIMLRIRLNPNIFQISDKSKGVEFSKLEIIFPFPNRPPLCDINKCSTSQGKIIILEQNRHIMVWTLGSILKKNEACLIGSVKFQNDSTQASFVDKFCVQSNAYVKVNFVLKNTNLSGFSVDSKSILFSMDSGVKIIQKQECTSYNFNVWNSLGVCPIELCN